TRRRQQGVTLVETMIVAAIAVVCVGAVVPSFDAARQRHRVEGAAAQLETDLQHVRGLAVLHGRSVRIGFSNAGACYVVHTGAAGECRCSADGSAVCSAGAVPLRVVALAGAGLALHSNSASMVFDPVRGTVTPTATIEVASADGMRLRNVVNIMGRV